MEKEWENLPSPGLFFPLEKHGQFMIWPSPKTQQKENKHIQQEKQLTL